MTRIRPGDDSRDWRRIARGFLIKRDPGALREARAILQRDFIPHSPHWQPVAEFLERVERWPHAPDHATWLPGLVWLPPNDAMTLALLAYWPLARESGGDAHAAFRAALEGSELARRLKDDRVRMAFLGAALRLETGRSDLLRCARARSLSDLGELLNGRGRLRSARRRFEEAVEILRALETDRTDLARTLLNLSRVLRAAWELRVARQRAEEALGAFSPDEPPSEIVIGAANELGIIALATGDPDGALRHLDAALDLLPRDPGASDARQREAAWALLQNRARACERLDDRQGAREALARALTMAEAGVDPATDLRRIATLESLARFHARDRRFGPARPFLAEALALCRSEGRLGDEARRAEARILLGLGSLAAGTGDLDEARARTREALDRIEGIDIPAARVDRVRALANLGLYELTAAEAPESRMAALSAARSAFSKALDENEEIRARMTGSRGRAWAARLGRLVSELAVIAAAEAWDLDRDASILAEAFEAAEAGRARHLADLLARAVPRPAGDVPTPIIDAYVMTRRALHRAYLRPMPGSSSNVDRSLARRSSEYEAALSEVRFHDPAFAPDGPPRPIRFEELDQILPRDRPTALIVFAVGRGGGKALILSAEGSEAVDLPGLAASELRHVARAWASGLKLAHREAGGSRSRRPSKSEGARRLSALLEEIANRIVRPVARVLAGRGLERLVLMPSRQLHLLPLGACPVPGLGHDTRLHDLYEVVTVPSVAMMKHSGRPLSSDSGVRPRVSLDSTGSLPFALAEGALIRRRLEEAGYEVPRPGTEEGPCRPWEDALRGCRLLHFAGHAQFDARRPLRSALLTTADETGSLSLREIFDRVRLPDSALVFLSGCETGLVDPQPTDPAFGLATGFLMAGARAVVSSLWAIDDVSATLIADQFYVNWLRGDPPAVALTRAQAWLRGIPDGRALRDAALTPSVLEAISDPDVRSVWEIHADASVWTHPHSPPYASPYDWAGFVVSGIGGGVTAGRPRTTLKAS